jgi:ketopantoate hydroxymethyltransferase
MSTTVSSHKPKFVRRFADGKSVREAGVAAFTEAVRARTFPDVQTESYGMEREQWELFVKNVEEKGTKY